MDAVNLQANELKQLKLFPAVMKCITSLNTKPAIIAEKAVTSQAQHVKKNTARSVWSDSQIKSHESVLLMNRSEDLV